MTECVEDGPEIGIRERAAQIVDELLADLSAARRAKVQKAIEAALEEWGQMEADNAYDSSRMS